MVVNLTPGMGKSFKKDLIKQVQGSQPSTDFDTTSHTCCQDKKSQDSWQETPLRRPSQSATVANHNSSSISVRDELFSQSAD